MFSGIGPTELIIVLVIVLLIFGPKRLPGLGRQLGSGMREFKDSISGIGGKDERRRRRASAADEPPQDRGRARPPRGRAGAARGRRRVRAPLVARPPSRDASMARAALRPVSHDDRLSLVEHLDELRTRLFICLGAFLVCFAVCFWQNGPILDDHEPAAGEDGVPGGQRGPVRALGELPADAEAALPPGGAGLPRARDRRERLSAATRRMLARARAHRGRDGGQDAAAVGQAAQ